MSERPLRPALGPSADPAGGGKARWKQLAAGFCHRREGFHPSSWMRPRVFGRRPSGGPGVAGRQKRSQAWTWPLRTLGPITAPSPRLGRGVSDYMCLFLSGHHTGWKSEIKVHAAWLLPRLRTNLLGVPLPKLVFSGIPPRVHTTPRPSLPLSISSRELFRGAPATWD